jgi:penicillin V acylase-like amidase (Ntn superfamily)
MFDRVTRCAGICADAASTVASPPLSDLAASAETVSEDLLTGSEGDRMCTRAMWSDNGQAVLVGRNMDWLQDMGTNLWALPRGRRRRGLEDGNPLEWTVGHGSLVATDHDRATVDGMNERGLGAHLLWLAESEFGEPDKDLPGVSTSLWAQVFLDQFVTVAECVQFVHGTPFEVWPLTDPDTDRPATVHLALDDAAGDSAVIEYIGGKPHLYHDRTHPVMTNSPPFDRQLAHLRHYQGFGGDQPLPGTTDPADRFVRASYCLEHLPRPSSRPAAVAGLLSVMRNAAQPFGVADPSRPNVSSTIWRSVCDLSNLVYYYESSYSPNLIWTRLDGLRLGKGAPPTRLDLVQEQTYVGEVSDRFVPAEPFAFAMP